MARLVLADLDTQRRVLAAHEAGHAVALHRHGYPITRVRMWVERGQAFGYTETPADPVALVFLAGLEAGDRVAPYRYVQGPCDDIPDAVEALRGTGVSLGAARAEARRWVRREWRRIARVAAALERKGELSGRQVARLA